MLVRVLQKAVVGLRERMLNWGQETELQFWPCLHLAVVCKSARQRCEHRARRPVNFCCPESEESK